MPETTEAADSLLDDRQSFALLAIVLEELLPQGRHLFLGSKPYGPQNGSVASQTLINAASLT